MAQAEPAAPEKPTPRDEAPIVPTVRIAEFVEYTDYHGTTHVAIVTEVAAAGRASMVSFAAIDGDEATERQRAVAYNADAKVFNSWRKLAR